MGEEEATMRKTYWQGMDAAPKGGQILLSYWRDTPVMIAWVRNTGRIETVSSGIWPFIRYRKVFHDESGWRVLMLDRDGGYAVHGNYSPFQPPFWMFPPARASIQGE